MVTTRGLFRLAQHRYARSPAEGPSRRSRGSSPDLDCNEFGNLDELDFSENTAFDKEAQVLRAPELDDLHDTDNLTPLWLAAPSELQADSGVERRTDAQPSAVDERIGHPQPPGALLRRGGQHRKPLLTGSGRGRLLITAMAAGATAAAAHSATPSNPTKAEAVLAADASALNGGTGTTSTRGMQMVTVKPAANVAWHNEEFANGVAYAQERAQREARLQQPLFVMPTEGIFTSSFGYRWGVLHPGIDLANSIGTPIVAVSDGVVIAAGPTAGYGMWVKLRHADGTVTLYGHVNTTMVNVGDRVMAGDQIATMGNRGDSTGPHLHFEVLPGGTNRVDPVPWLAQRGLSVGPYSG
ncbi:MAG TPA: M23 family metallopeptidase [Mycobacterium sp.]|nr:M23 family metallopeptidase [Mycobacterium sp.]